VAEFAKLVGDADLAVSPLVQRKLPARGHATRPFNGVMTLLRIIHEVDDRNSRRFLRIFNKLPLASNVGSGLKGLGVERMPSDFVGEAVGSC
jgi:hypothetical protein